jgi:hypothetical protein
MDFLDSHEVLIDIKNKRLSLLKNVKVCSLSTCRAYARTKKHTVIKPNSESRIPVKIARVKSDQEILLEPFSTLHNQNLIGAKCLVKVKNGKSVFRVVNPTDRPVHLAPNKI